MMRSPTLRGLIARSNVYSSHGKRSISTTPLRYSAKIPRVPLYIGGKAIDTSSAGTVTQYHAKTGEESCEVVVAGEEETYEAIKSSKEAFGIWRETTPQDRRKVLLKVLSLLQDRFDILRSALLSDVSMSEISIGADRKSALGLVEGSAQTAISMKVTKPATIDGSDVTTTREPFGPVLSIPAFNFPMTLALRSIVDPLACGNTVIFKSSAYIPQLHSLLHPLLADAGLPAGALQILNFSEEDVGDRVEQLISSPDVRMVNFTGSTKLGRILAVQCGKYLKPSIMELGGKSAAIVLPSADLELAANNIIFGALFNSGQVCMSTERVLVHDSILDKMQKELERQWVEVKEKEFDLVRPGSVHDVKVMIDDAVDKGGQNLFSSPKLTSTSSTPQILFNPSETSTIWTEETFSPTFTLIPYSTQTDLIDKLNSVPTGLSASIFGETGSALEMARHVECGSVHINGMTIHDEAALPFGGVRESGWGRYNGQGAIEGFTWIKNVRVVKDVHALPLGAL